MARAYSFVRSGAVLRFDLSFWLKGLAARTRPQERSRPHPLLEPLEQRMMLSSTSAASPDYVLGTKASFLGSTQPNITSGPNGLSPATLRQAYLINQVRFGSIVGDGTGQTIAIVDAYGAPTLQSDVRRFDQTFGLPALNLTVIGQDGSTNLPGPDPAGPGADGSWSVETSLDVEWAHAVAPGANIVLVEANTNFNQDLFTAVDTARNYPGVSVVSMSFGSDEDPTDTQFDSILTTPAGHTGVTFIASSGDDGALGPGGFTPTVGYPAASDGVLSVGGTSLFTNNSTGAYQSESAWKGSGGGISLVETQPMFQKGNVSQSRTARLVPDVSMDADPNQGGVSIIDAYDFGAGTPWAVIGGTSLAAPLWAGVIALANQGLATQNLGPLDGATQTLPDIYSLPSADFHDITTGSNGYSAGVGYDLATGRGTPIVNKLVAGLSGVPLAAVLPTIGSFSISPNPLAPGPTVTLTASGLITSTGKVNHIAFYAETNNTAGLQPTPSTGSQAIPADTFLGNGKLQKNGSYTLSFSTSSMTPGNYTYYAVMVDSIGVSSLPSTSILTLAAPPGNDNLTTTTPALTGLTATALGSNIGATKGKGDPVLAGNVGGKSVWWTWTAPVTGLVTLDTEGSDFDTLLGVMAAVASGKSGAKLTVIASSDDVSTTGKSGDVSSSLTFVAIAGTTYDIDVDGYFNGTTVASGNITLNLAETPGPSNDNFANAVNLTGVAATWQGSNIGATRQAGEPNIAGNPGGASIWFTWTAATTGSVSLNTSGSLLVAATFDQFMDLLTPAIPMNTLLAVYTGSSVTALTYVAGNDDVSNTDATSALTFQAVAGKTYDIVIDGYNGQMGTLVNLNLNVNS